MGELKITNEVDDGVIILRMAGKSTIGEGSVAFKKAVEECLTAGAKRIVIDWSGISYIDSSGMGEVISTFTTALKQECILVYANVGHKLRDLTAISKIFTVVSIYPSVESAVKAIKEQSFSDFVTELRKEKPKNA